MERAEAIRKLCRLGGVRADATDEELRTRYPEQIEAIIPRSTGLDASAVLQNAASMMPPNLRSAKAILNALFTDDQSSLGDRREPFMKEHEISLRTLVREEEAGADLLDSYILKLVNKDNPHYDADLVIEASKFVAQAKQKADEDGYTPAVMLVIERIEKLQSTVDAIAAKLGVERAD